MAGSVRHRRHDATGIVAQPVEDRSKVRRIAIEEHAAVGVPHDRVAATEQLGEQRVRTRSERGPRSIEASAADVDAHDGRELELLIGHGVLLLLEAESLLLDSALLILDLASSFLNLLEQLTDLD